MGNPGRMAKNVLSAAPARRNIMQRFEISTTNCVISVGYQIERHAYWLRVGESTAVIFYIGEVIPASNAT